MFRSLINKLVVQLSLAILKRTDTVFYKLQVERLGFSSIIMQRQENGL